MGVLSYLNLKGRLKYILLSPAVQGIDLRMAHMRITGASYRWVVNALGSGRIEIKIGGIPSGGAAAFDNGAFRFPDVTFGLLDAGARRSIVHESTHAFFHLFYNNLALPRTSMPDTLNEAAACIAAELYLLRAGEVSSDELPQHQKAKQIVGFLVNNLYTEVPVAELAQLRQILASRPAYQRMGVTYNSYNVPL
jgi:hypothetical protein